MKFLLSFLAINIAGIAMTAQAQQLPEKQPTEWSVAIRFYGTTDPSNRADLHVFVHTNGALPASIQAIRPEYDERTNNVLMISLESMHKQNLKDEVAAAIYSSVRSLIHNHQIGESPKQAIADGGSVEITVTSYDRSLSVAFHHSSAAKSKEFGALIRTLESTLPKEFLSRVETRFNFPYLLPGSQTILGEELVDGVNALETKDEQIQFLINILPPADQEKKQLSDRQLYAIRLLSLTDSNAVIEPLMNRLDFTHSSDGRSVVHALARLGERGVEPLLKRLQHVASDRQKAAACVATLVEIKKDQFPMFIIDLKRRKDMKVSGDVVNEMLEQYRFPPHD